ncbi:MAG: hypothetical protein ACJ79M_24145 [Myxococcales bacterium]
MSFRLGAMLVLVAAQAVPADGGTSPGRCRITVRAISATSGPDPGSTDPKLAPIEQNLREFSKDFRFKHFRLVSEETNDLGWKKQAQVALPGSRTLQVEPQQMGGDGRIKVHLELLGEHPSQSRKLHTDYSIQRGGTIFVGGMRLAPERPDEGMLLIAVTAQSID